ncbi:MAG: DUF3667 domain-containing protein [Caulobacteraceae bacterium]|nr:DUF3667 domain-containing protein [Caulobacteraceae bacterium]
MAEKEIEIVGLAALGDWLKGDAEAPPEGARCANCQAVLQGPYCHNCGQVADDYHRSIWELAKEALSSWTNLDSKLMRTVPRLFLNPAQLTNDYLAGKRAGQVPPLRMFLVVVLVFFVVGGLGGGDTNFVVGGQPPPEANLARAEFDLQKVLVDEGIPFSGWIGPRLGYAAEHPEEFAAELREWPHRIAIMLMPIGALILGLLYAFSRRFFLFDHLIFTMHSLSFMGLLVSLMTLLGLVPVLSLLNLILVFAIPAHLFLHMRGVYGSGAVGTLARMAVLGVGTFAAFVVLILLAVGFGVSAMPGGSS